ncbi:MAG: chemotaxis protein CheW [Chloroflexota bacterium]|nr:chemotaxis protein CheW [Chloroflexota bacterium]
MTPSDTMKKESRLVVFQIAGDTYGIDANTVDRVIPAKYLNRQGEKPDFVEGLIGFRKRVIPVVDLRKKFGFTIVNQSKYDHIMLVNISGQEIGLLVDAAIGVLRTCADPSETLTLTDNIIDWDYLFGIEELGGIQMKFLDLDQLFSKEERILLLKIITEHGWIV